MKKILVVDNSPVMLQFMRKLLEKKRHRVMTAKDGLSALDILKSFVPDVVFIDLVMPNISGEKLCEIIRGKPQFKDVFIVIVTAIAKEQELDFVGFGANACIAKCPFNKLEEYFLYVLDQMDSEGSCELSRQVIGLADIYRREITKELLSSKKHSEVILSNISEGVLELTPEGKVVYANPTAISLTGLPEAKLLASNFTEFFPKEDDRKRISNVLGDIGGVREAINYNSPALLNGRQITLQISEVKDEGQQSAIAILNDISERKRAEAALCESEERYRNILESINEGYYEVDLFGKLTFFNASLCEMSGYARAELMGMNLRDLTDQEGFKRPILDNILTNEDPVRDVDWVIFRKDGTKDTWKDPYLPSRTQKVKKSVFVVLSGT